MDKLFFMILLLMMARMAFSQSEGGTNAGPERLRVNLDCNFCDLDYIRQQIDYVGYVRDQGNADVHVFFVRNTSGSGGKVYDISFFGKNNFEESFFKLSFSTNKLDFKDEVRKKITDNILAGLVPFLYNSQPGYNIKVTPEENTENEDIMPAQIIDPWRNWVFEVYGSGNFEWESQQREIEYRYGLEVDRITPDYRINHDLFTNSNKKIIQDTIIIKVARSFYSGRLIKSINEHWSAGVFTTLESNSYRNINLLSNSKAAIEYNVFPWSVLSKKQFTFNYQVGYLYQDYVLETIYNKNSDLVPVHSLGAEVMFNQPWGSIDSELEISQFVNNPQQKRLEFEFNISVRILKGLSARISGEYKVIRDQINLAKGKASVQDIISRQREIATDFGAELRLGLSYTFGTMYNNAVNQRL